MWTFQSVPPSLPRSSLAPFPARAPHRAPLWQFSLCTVTAFSFVGRRRRRRSLGARGKAEFLALKHTSRTLGHTSHPVCGFSMTVQVRLCACLANGKLAWLFLEPDTSWTTVRESYSRALEEGPRGKGEEGQIHPARRCRRRRAVMPFPNCTEERTNNVRCSNDRIEGIW